jgi:MbtH protein
MSDDADDRPYKVVVNHEEQYSIWLSSSDLPSGWRVEGFEGTRAACLEYIDRVWVDMRPLSVRQHMDETARGQHGG